MGYITIDAGAVKRLDIGKQGENLATRIDYGNFLEECRALYGEGVLTLAHQRHNDEAPYLIALDEGRYWNVTSADLQDKGTGCAEATYVVGEVVKKSLRQHTNTLEALGETEEPPAPWVGYVDRVTQIVDGVYSMTVTAHESTVPEVVKSRGEGGRVNLDFGLVPGPQGPQGPQGETGPQGEAADIGRTVHELDVPEIGYVGKRRLKPNGTIYPTGNEAYRLYKLDVSGLADGENGVFVRSYKTVTASNLPFISLTSVAYDDISADSVTAESILGEPVKYAAEYEGETRENYLLPPEAKTLLICVSTGYESNYPRVIGKRYGAFAEDFGELKSALSDLQTEVDGKQEALVSGKTIKTINGESVLGNGNIVIRGGEEDKPWVLKGTLTTDNKDTGVDVELSGCKEVTILGGLASTAPTSLRLDSKIIIYNLSGTNTERTFIAELQDTLYGFKTVGTNWSGYNNPYTVTVMTGSTYNWMDGTKLESFKRLSFISPSVITKCDIKIYAR